MFGAAKESAPVVPLYLWSPEAEGEWPPGAASRWWLHRSLDALATRLREAGSSLVVRKGPAEDAVRKLAAELGGAAVFWNRSCEPLARQRDAAAEQSLSKSGIAVRTFSAALLHEPAEVLNSAGKPFQVFTAFWKRCLDSMQLAEPLPRPECLAAPRHWPRSLHLQQLGLEPRQGWAGGLQASWTPGEGGASKLLDRFLGDAFARYEIDRNRPDFSGTSRLSPHLHFGEISVNQVWHAVKAKGTQKPRTHPKREGVVADTTWRHCQFITELGWREFSHYLLYHYPHTVSEPLRSQFTRFPWRTIPEWLRAWQKGATGYPLVDAGMRELWSTGWMHNRVRMIVASLLVKDLLISWQEGADWFWHRLVDADLAQNTFNWQWCAGCGADAAPFFRIFNPVTQGEKFDPAGAYVRRWIPELARMPDGWIHKPHLAPSGVLARAGVELGRTYPRPIVSHSIAREVALEAYQKIR